jgi:hypothetical protein
MITKKLENPAIVCWTNNKRIKQTQRGKPPSQPNQQDTSAARKSLPSLISKAKAEAEQRWTFLSSKAVAQGGRSLLCWLGFGRLGCRAYLDSLLAGRLLKGLLVRIRGERGEEEPTDLATTVTLAFFAFLGFSVGAKGWMSLGSAFAFFFGPWEAVLGTVIVKEAFFC